MSMEFLLALHGMFSVRCIPLMPGHCYVQLLSGAAFVSNMSGGLHCMRCHVQSDLHIKSE